MLEYEVNKTQELQDSIDKYREKIRTLKKRKSGEKKFKFEAEIEEDSIIIPPSQFINPRVFNELKGRLGPACKELLKSTGLAPIINENDLIADLLQKAAARKRQRRELRDSKKSKSIPVPSSSSSELSEDDSDSSRDSSPRPRPVMGAMRHRRGKKK